MTIAMMNILVKCINVFTTYNSFVKYFIQINHLFNDILGKVH